MRILRLMLVLALLVTHYPVASFAAGGMADCPMEKMTGHKMDAGKTAAGKIKDCCKEKTGKSMQCPCGSCNGCMAAPAALAEGIMLALPVLQPAPEQLAARVLSHLTLIPGLRPPDFLA